MYNMWNHLLKGVAVRKYSIFLNNFDLFPTWLSAAKHNLFFDEPIHCLYSSILKVSNFLLFYLFTLCPLSILQVLSYCILWHIFWIVFVPTILVFLLLFFLNVSILCKLSAKHCSIKKWTKLKVVVLYCTKIIFSNCTVYFYKAVE